MKQIRKSEPYALFGHPVIEWIVLLVLLVIGATTAYFIIQGVGCVSGNFPAGSYCIVF